MERITRQQIIDLINLYIYTNGTQKITAAQLKEILLDIARAFAMEGGSAGIDGVLEAGSEVINGREITNGFGGKLQLAVANDISLFGSIPVPEDYKYLGIGVSETPYLGQVYSSNSRTVIGNIQTEDPSKNLFFVKPAEEGEFYAGTIYNVYAGEPKVLMAPDPDAPFTFRKGITSIVRTPEYTSTHGVFDTEVSVEIMDEGKINGVNHVISPWSVSTYIGNEEAHAQYIVGPSTYEATWYNANNSSYARRTQSYYNVETVLFNGPQTSTHRQSAQEHRWSNEKGEIAVINNAGFTLEQGKRLNAISGGSAPTCGLVNLASGTATVNTTAVTMNSVISLTVQESGTFGGNIRVSSKTIGTGFVISSGSADDNCKVFWQIIDIF